MYQNGFILRAKLREHNLICNLWPKITQEMTESVMKSITRNNDVNHVKRLGSELQKKNELMEEMIDTFIISFGSVYQANSIAFL